MSSMPSDEQPQHYALVSSSDPLELPIQDENAFAAGTTIATTATTSSTDTTSRSSTQDALVSLYQSYAERFPNPRLIEEYQERDQLLQATSAAHSAHSQSKRKKGGGGFFGFLFGSSGDDETKPNLHDLNSNSNRNDEEKDFLVYTEVEDNEADADDYLCGTNHSLDRTCIPQDAHSMARLVLASTRTRKERPHVVRTSPQLPSSSTFCIVGLGMIAEWNQPPPPPPENGDDINHDNNNNAHDGDLNMQSNWSLTSDHEDLVHYASTRDFDLSLVRAVALGPNFLIVSWGFQDGIAVLYRRIILVDKNNNVSNISWEAVVFLGPSQAVQEHSFDLFAEDDNNTSSNQDSGSDLLRITDMAPLVVATPIGPAVAMAISRLGGYMEVFPVPGSLWFGPPLDVSRHKPRNSHAANNKRKRGRNAAAPHYAKAYLVNIASEKAPIDIMALSTMDYHLDILCLEAIRTRVTMDTVWDRKLYGNAPPPAEYILVASGTLNGHEILTFWAVTFLFAEGEPPRDGSAGFTLQANLQEALDVMEMGADLSIFVNRAIMNHWRHPRKVSLKEQPPPPPPPPENGDEEGDFSQRGDDAFHKSSLEDDDNQTPSTSVYDRVTTITMSAPIVSIQAIVVPMTDEDGNPSSVVMLSLLDWNGSVTVMDCSLLERMISHSLSKEEYKLILEADMAAGGDDAAPPEPIALVKTVVDRSRMMQWMKSGIRGLTLIQQCVSVQWLSRPEDPADPWLILLTSPTTSSGSRRHRSRAMILSRLLMLDEATMPEPFIQTVPFPTSQATLQGSVGGITGNGGAPPSSSLLKIVFPHKKKPQKLCVCFLQPLQPREIILALARDGKYEKAIESAGQLSSEEQQQVSGILEECRQKLWERTLDLRWFKQVTDVAYIIQQALSLFENDADEHAELKPEDDREEGVHYGLMKIMDMGKCREICLLALQRTTKLRLASALAVGHGTEEARDKLQGMVVSMGTFQLLCQVLNTEATMEKYRKHYQMASVVDLAKSFAPAGDVAALSILFFRHGRELHPHKLEILNLLPLTVTPRNYCHLLPLIPPEQHENNDKIGFFITDIPPCDGECLQHISQLPSFLRDELDVRVVLDFKDEKMVLERTMRSAPMCFQHKELQPFYLARTQGMQRFAGNLKHLADFCAVGLLAMGKNVDVMDTEAAWAVLGGEGHTLHKLFCTRGCALALERMLEEAVVDAPLVEGEDGLVDLSPFATITPLDLQSMNLVDVVKMVLGGQDDSETISEIYNQHLIPLLKYLPVDHQNSQLDQAIYDFCVGLIQTSEVAFGLSEEGMESTGTSMVLDDREDTLLSALKTCAAIAKGSRTSIRKAGRIIANKRILVSLVLAIINEVSQRCQNVKMPRNVCTAVVGMMWEMYESLPSPVSATDKEANDYADLMNRADILYKDLVGLDILSQWPEAHEHAFSFVAKRIQPRDDEDANQRLLIAGQDALASLCRSFCSQAKAQKGTVGLSSLLRHLTSDFQQFFEVCYDSDESFVPLLVTTLSAELISPLSSQAEFDLVAQLLNSIDEAWWDPEQEAHLVRSYVEAVVFSDGKDQTGRPSPTGNHSLQAAIACQDALGPVFPDLQKGFQLSRRYLDAAHFINSVLFSELSVPKEIKPNDLRGDLPLDVVESILRAIPRAIVVRCKEWGDEAMAAHANRALRDEHENAAMSPDHVDAKNLPPLPGGAVFYLAGILGLDDAASVLVVKSRVVHYGVASGLYGASAAVCRSILHDEDAFGNDADSVARITAVAEVVSQENFADLATKKELCLGALCRFQTSTSIHNCRPLDAIIATHKMIELQMRRAQLESERHQILNIPPLSDSIGSLFKDTLSQYKVNIYDLFATLQIHSASGVVDDSLLNALSRYVFFSCIFRSSRPRTEEAGKLERATVNELLVIGAALMLHIQKEQAFSIPAIQELRQILEKQIMAVINQHPKAFDDPFLVADEDIVRQLISRGFPPMAARWSALATKNAGVPEALQFGITNAQNPRMNDPIVQVASPQRVFLEKPSIQQVMNTFAFTGQFLSGTRTPEMWVSMRSALHSDTPPGTTVDQADPVATKMNEEKEPIAAPVPVPVRPKGSAAPVLPKHVTVPAPAPAKPEMQKPTQPPPAPAPAPAKPAVQKATQPPPVPAPAPAAAKPAAQKATQPQSSPAPAAAPAAAEPAAQIATQPPPVPAPAPAKPAQPPSSPAPAPAEPAAQIATQPPPVAEPAPVPVPANPAAQKVIQPPPVPAPSLAPVPVPAKPAVQKITQPAPGPAKLAVQNATPAPPAPASNPVPKSATRDLEAAAPPQALKASSIPALAKAWAQEKQAVVGEQTKQDVTSTHQKPNETSPPPAQSTSSQAVVSRQLQSKPLPSARIPAPAPAPPNLTVSTQPIPSTTTNSLITPTNRPPSLHLGQSTGSSTASDRSTLRQQGEAAMEAARSKPNTPVEQSMEERRRLIEAGRRLLAKSRATFPGPSPPPKPSSGSAKPAYRPFQPIGATPSPIAAASPRIKTSVNATSPQKLTPPGQQSQFFGASSTLAKSNTAVSKSTSPKDSKQSLPLKASSPAAKVTKLAVADDDWGFDDSEHTNRTNSASVSRALPPPQAPPQAPPRAASPKLAAPKLAVPSSAYGAAAPVPKPTPKLVGRAGTGPVTATTASITQVAPQTRAPAPTPSLFVPAATHTTTPAAPSQPQISNDDGWDFDSSDLGIDLSQSNHQAPEATSAPPAEQASSGDPVVTKLAVEDDKEDDGWGFDDF